MIRAVDLCCGAGGWACAAKGLPIEWVAVVDLAPDARETWHLNHGPSHPHCRVIECDLSTKEGMDLVRTDLFNQRIDLIVGGIPCEQVSTARGANFTPAAEMCVWQSLIDNIFALVREKSPRWWCLEDVIQVEKYLPLPIEHGADYQVRRIEAEEYGPQRRLRSFIGSFPEPSLPVPGPRVLADCLRPGPYRTVPDQGRFLKVPAHSGRNSDRVGNDRVRVLQPDRPSPTVMGALDRGSRQRRAFMVDHGAHVRLLSWQEAALLQGFPEDYLFASGQGRAEKMIGQAIPIPVGRAILTAIVATKGAR